MTTETRQRRQDKTFTRSAPCVLSQKGRQAELRAGLHVLGQGGFFP